MNNDLDLLISFLQPIKELLLDDTVSEIMGNPNGQWWFERRGRVEHAEVSHATNSSGVGPLVRRWAKIFCGVSVKNSPFLSLVG